MRLITLGGLYLEGAEITRPKPLLLLSYLALEGTTPRTHLSELFFPESRDRSDALSTTLRRLRPLGVLEENRKKLGVCLPCDALEFLAGDSSAYRGAFLDGLSLTLNPELEEWLLETREKLALKRRELHFQESEAAWKLGDAVWLEREIESLLALSGAPPLEERDFARLLALPTLNSHLRRRLEDEMQVLGVSTLQVSELVPSTSAPHNLTFSVTSFVGRDLERLKVVQLLREGRARLLTLHGPGGIGKTRLALQVAHDALFQDIFRDGVYFVPLDALIQAQEVLPHLLTTLKLVLQPSETPLEALVRWLAPQRVLLVLDNFEGLLEASEVINTLLGRCSELSVLVTSRVRLGLKAEWCFPLEGLSLPPTLDFPSSLEDSALETLQLEGLHASEAVKLFLERAGQARLDFVLSPENALNVHRLCTLCAGFPLALELTAAWLRTRTLPQILRNLETQGIALETPHGDVRHRHRSMARALEHSWNLLSRQEQQGLAQLSVFVGGFTLEAALEVCRMERAVLDRLNAHSLLSVSLEGRYGFHPLIAEFARNKLLKYPEDALVVQQRHALYYLHSLHRLNLEAGGGVSKALFTFLQPEESNTLATLKYLLEHRRYPDLAQIAEPLLWHFPVNGRFADGLRVCAEVVAGWPNEAEEGFEALAAFLNSYGWLNYIAGSLSQAHSLCTRALSLAQGCGSELQALRALGHLGEVACMRGEHSAAFEYLNAAVAAAQRYGDPTRSLRAFNCLGIAQAMGNDPESALDTLEKSRTLLERKDVPTGMDAATFHIDLATTHFMRSEYKAGLAVAWSGIKLAQAIGSKGHETGLYGLVCVLTAYQDLEGQGLKGQGSGGLSLVGEELLEGLTRRFIPVVRVTPEPFAHALFFLATARLALSRGQESKALLLVTESLSSSLQVGALSMFTWVLTALADAYLRLADSTRAAKVIGFLLSSPTAGVWVRREAMSARDRLYSVTDLEQDLEQMMRRGSRMTPADFLNRLTMYEATLER